MMCSATSATVPNDRGRFKQREIKTSGSDPKALHAFAEQFDQQKWWRKNWGGGKFPDGTVRFVKSGSTPGVLKVLSAVIFVGDGQNAKQTIHDVPLWISWSKRPKSTLWPPSNICGRERLDE